MRGKKIIGMTIALAMLLSAMPLAIPRAVATSTPNVYIDPPSATPEVGTDFSVNIMISGVVSPDDVYTWGLRLTWNPIMLDFVSATEGSFLLDVAPEGTFFIVGDLPPARQYVDIADSILGAYTGASTDGTPGLLATVTFHVLDIGATPIDIMEPFVQLITSGLHVLPFTATDGTVDVHSDWITNPNFYATLVEKRVDDRHWSLSIKGTLITLYAKVKNEAFVPLYVRARFTGVTPIGARKWDTAIANIMPNDMTHFLTYGQALTPGMRGTYIMQVYALYSYGGYRWFADSHKVKDLTFDVVD